MTAFVIDTNVAVVANRGHAQAGPDCVKQCVRALVDVRRGGKVVLDDGTLILGEYRTCLSFKGQPGVGDAFFKWLWDRQAMSEHCERVHITPTNGSFAEFPNDPDLYRFHADDRKFVAVALASSSAPEVLNAVDEHWWRFRDPLRRHGVRIRFLCPEQFRSDGRDAGRDPGRRRNAP